MLLTKSMIYVWIKIFYQQYNIHQVSDYSIQFDKKNKIDLQNSNNQILQHIRMQKLAPPQLLITEIGLKQQTLPDIDRGLKNEILKDLSPDELAKIKKGFDLYQGSAEMKQFIAIMIDSLYGQYSFKKLQKQVMTFIELFLLIDINNKQKIRFQDFTNFLIDRQGKEAKTKQYQFFPAKSMGHFDIQADNVFPITNHKLLALLVDNRKKLQLLDLKSGKVDQQISFGGIIVNNVIYIPEYEAFCIATNDKHLNFYDAKENQLFIRFSVPQSIFHLLVNHDRILVGAANGFIYEFSLKKLFAHLKKEDLEKRNQSKDEKKQAKKKNQVYKTYLANQKNPYTQQRPDLTCMALMQSLQLVVTGSNDAKVRLYQMRNEGLKLNKQLQGHYKGIKAVTVSVQHKVIVSCSFDFDLLVWNAYLQHPVARLEGHQAPLVSVYCPLNFQIIISLDSKGIMKIWSCQNYTLTQNIVPLGNNPLNSSINFIYKEQNNYAIIFTRRLIFYEFTVNYDPKLTDNYDISAIKYSGKNLQVYIGSKNTLKVWSITKGIMLRAYENIVTNQIAVIQLDQRHRRAFIGSIDGQIISLDIFSGIIINHYSSHQQEISMLFYDKQNQLLITGGWDKVIKIHNDTRHLDKIDSRENVLRIIKNMHEKQLTNGSFTAAEFLIATHCRTRILRLWDFEKGYLDAQFVLSNDINLVHFIDPLPIIVITDAKGGIFLFSSKHAKKPYQLLAHWRNMYSIQKASQITFISSIFTGKKQPLTSRSDCNKMVNTDVVSCDLILGDEYGYVRIIDMTQFLAQNSIKPIIIQSLGNKNPYRIQDYVYSGSSELSVNTHDFSSKETKNIVPPAFFKQKLQIKSHNDRITYIALINEQKNPMWLTSGSDKLVKIWGQQGSLRGIMRQGQKKNQNWYYNLNDKWRDREFEYYEKVTPELNKTFKNYMQRKRQNIIPFTQDEKFEEVDNVDIYKNLKEVDILLNKEKKKTSKRIY